MSVIQHFLRMSWVAFGLLLVVKSPLLAAAPPSPVLPGTDVTGSFLFEMDNLPFKLLLTIRRDPDGTLRATQDDLARGEKDRPAEPFFIQGDSVRLESYGMFKTLFTGKFNADKSALAGMVSFGHMTVPMTYRRIDPSKLPPEPKVDFTPPPPGTQDARGFWRAEFPSERMSTRVGLQIGRVEGAGLSGRSSFIDRGENDILLSSVSQSNTTVRIESRQWEVGFSFEGTLDAQGNQIVGTLKNRGQPTPATFTRIARPLVAEQPVVSDAAVKGSQGAEGYWSGMVEVGSGDLRISLAIGKGSDGKLLAAARNLDERKGPIPSSSVVEKDSNVRIEFKTLGYHFEGRLSPDGLRIQGTWVHDGQQDHMVLHRVNTPVLK